MVDHRGGAVVSLRAGEATAVHVSGTEFPNSNRTPDHQHHYAISTKSILTDAHQKKQSWVTQLGFFNTRRNDVVNVNNNTQIIPYNPSKNNCC